MGNNNLLKDEKFWTILLGGIGCIALIWNLINNPNDWANILVNFAQIGVAVIVFIVAFSTRERSTSFVQLSKEVLERLSKKYNNFLLPPRYNRDNYDPEKGAGLQYLFITNADKNSSRRAKFVPIDPISQGIVTIYVQKGTLVYGLNYKSEEATPEEIKRIQQIVYESVNNYIKNNYEGLYELITPSKDDTAIIIDFYEEKMKKRKFIRAIADVSEIATSTLYKMRK
ncbi:MAG: hypothetical protein FD143_3164 [Ignavibacteria bacterium]|nr:MAG: hypothetical protein FD143_3164 [Ignavibacteria bacterium]KAF0154139.1 MAG: hypothetical protein FD188_3293 [Ignavibacteria bacterium]